jgi:ribosomal protein L16 Arg81 hydroxylase
VYLEADDIGSAMEQIALSEEPFDQWFRERIQEVHGVDLAEPQPPPEQVLDTRF